MIYLANKYKLLRDCYNMRLKEKYEEYLPMPEAMELEGDTEAYYRYAENSVERGFLSKAVKRSTGFTMKSPIEVNYGVFDYFSDAINNSESMMEFIKNNTIEQNLLSRCIIGAFADGADISLERYMPEQVLYHRYARVNRSKKCFCIVVDDTVYNDYYNFKYTEDNFDIVLYAFSLVNGVAYRKKFNSHNEALSFANSNEILKYIPREKEILLWLGKELEWEIPFICFGTTGVSWSFENPNNLDLAELDLLQVRLSAKLQLFNSRALPIINIAGSAGHMNGAPASKDPAMRYDVDKYIEAGETVSLDDMLEVDIAEVNPIVSAVGTGNVIYTTESGNVRSITPNPAIGQMFIKQLDDVSSTAEELSFSLGESKVNKDASGTTTSIVLDAKTSILYMQFISQIAAINKLMKIVENWGDLENRFNIIPAKSFFSETINPAVLQQLVVLAERGSLSIDVLERVLSESFNFKVDLKEIKDESKIEREA